LPLETAVRACFKRRLRLRFADIRMWPVSNLICNKRLAPDMRNRRAQNLLTGAESNCALKRRCLVRKIGGEENWDAGLICVSGTREEVRKT